MCEKDIGYKDLYTHCTLRTYSMLLINAKKHLLPSTCITIGLQAATILVTKAIENTI